jgi:hypothetical protein
MFQFLCNHNTGDDEGFQQERTGGGGVGWGGLDSNETWAPNCKKIATRIISFSFIHLLSKTQNESVTKGEKKTEKIERNKNHT